MCDSYFWLDRLHENQAITERRNEFYERCDKLVWNVAGDSLTFYRAWGAGKCKGCTSWCVQHCYMNIKNFMSNKRRKLKEVYSLPEYGTCIKRCPDEVGEMPFDKNIIKAQYVSFWGSGTINDARDAEFVINTIRNYPDKHYRIFTRNLEFAEEFYGNTIIFSADLATDKGLLEKALKNKNINIAVLNHRDNAELINDLKSKIPVVLACEECMKDGYSKQLCFHEKNRFLSIQNYEEVEKYV